MPEHLVEPFPVRRLDLGFDRGLDAAPIMVVDRHAKSPRALGDRKPNASHADDAKALAVQPHAEHCGGRPALPASGAHQSLALADAPRDGQNQRHRHVGCIFSQNAGRVGDDDAARFGRLERDMVNARAERRDELQIRAGTVDQRGIEIVGHGRNQNLGLGHRLREFALAERMVVEIEPAVEQLHHARFDLVGQFARDDHERPAAGHGKRVSRGKWRQADGWRSSRMPPLSRIAGTAILAVMIRILSALLVLAVLAVPSAANAQTPRENLPVPRFVSLRSEEVNLRTGPGVRYPVEWVFVRRQMPVEILQEFENWRRIRDRDGTEGWVHQSMLTGRRAAVVEGEMRNLRRRPEAEAPVVARVEPGVVAAILECKDAWCRLETAGFRGWVPRTEIWGVYPNEAIK